MSTNQLADNSHDLCLRGGLASSPSVRLCRLRCRHRHESPRPDAHRAAAHARRPGHSGGGRSSRSSPATCPSGSMPRPRSSRPTSTTPARWPSPTTRRTASRSSRPHNRYYLRHSGTNTLFNTLPRSPFRQNNDAADQQTTRAVRAAAARARRAAGRPSCRCRAPASRPPTWNSRRWAARPAAYETCHLAGLRQRRRERFISVHVNPVTGLVGDRPARNRAARRHCHASIAAGAVSRHQLTYLSPLPHLAIHGPLASHNDASARSASTSAPARSSSCSFTGDRSRLVEAARVELPPLAEQADARAADRAHRRRPAAAAWPTATSAAARPCCCLSDRQIFLQSLRVPKQTGAAARPAGGPGSGRPRALRHRRSGDPLSGSGRRAAGRPDAARSDRLCRAADASCSRRSTSSSRPG